MLVLKLDNLLETAMESVLVDESKRMEVIDKEQKRCNDRLNEVNAAARMVDLKMRAEKRTKFV